MTGSTHTPEQLDAAVKDPARLERALTRSPIYATVRNTVGLPASATFAQTTDALRRKLADDDEVAADAAPHETWRALGRRVREAKLSAAVNDRRIPAHKLDEWRATYDQDPAATTAALSAIPVESVAGIPPQGLPTTPSPDAHTPPAPAPLPVSSRLTADENGNLTYDGRFPVAMSQAGEPCVFTGASGWMSVGAFEASGLSKDTLAFAHAVATSSLVPGSGLSAKFHAGPGA